VIAAGSTGSIPATAELIAAIAKLPHGAVVLPGLDTDLDEEAWRMIGGDESKGVGAASGTSAIRHAGAAARIGIAARRGGKSGEPLGASG
jgi:ATP-dependent helicase/nuclease subunit B